MQSCANYQIVFFNFIPSNKKSFTFFYRLIGAMIDLSRKSMAKKNTSYYFNVTPSENCAILGFLVQVHSFSILFALSATIKTLDILILGP